MWLLVGALGNRIAWREHQGTHSVDEYGVCSVAEPTDRRDLDCNSGNVDVL